MKERESEYEFDDSKEIVEEERSTSTQLFPVLLKLLLGRVTAFSPKSYPIVTLSSPIDRTRLEYSILQKF